MGGFWALRAAEPQGGFAYGAQWWMWCALPGRFAAYWYEGKYPLVVPARELVLTHRGKVTAERRRALDEGLRDLVRSASNGV